MILPSVASVAVVVSMVWGLDPLAPQEASREVAFVEAVTGRVVAFGSGAPALLDPLDVITDRTRVDLLASSELRICHYLTARFLTVKGPAHSDSRLAGRCPAVGGERVRPSHRSADAR